jgi:hypothetical protein
MPTSLPLPDQERSFVERYLFSPLYVAHSPWDVVRWWESRRVLYNVTVGAAGLLTLGWVTFLSLLAPPGWGSGGPPFGAVIAYGLAANVCYSAGAPIDLALRRVFGVRGGTVGQALFRYGLAFATGLTLLPIPVLGVLCTLAWIFR